MEFLKQNNILKVIYILQVIDLIVIYIRQVMEVQRRYENNRSIPQEKKTNNNSLLEITRSNSSIDSNENQYRKQAIMWILKLRKKFTIARDTIYVAIGYIIKWTDLGNALDEDNFQCIAATMVLISAKMNEIYPPKITSLIYRSVKEITKQNLIIQEGIVLGAFDYDFAFNETAYYFLAKIFESDKPKLQECDKLLSLVIPHRETFKYGDKMLALAIVYLIKPSHLKDYSGASLQRIKYISGRVYNIYISIKNNNKN